MKKFLFIVFIVIPASFHSQIKVADYPREIKCDIDGLYELPPIEATSDFGPVTTTLDEEIFSGGCLGTLVRTFTYKDKLDNKATAQQFVSILDKEAPRLYGVPENITVTRDKVPPAYEISSRDNSGNIYPVTLSEEATPTGLTRTWTCTDACGNTATAQQVITFSN
jgi:hypothetical protein